jgi:hypothetical protein
MDTHKWKRPKYIIIIIIIIIIMENDSAFAIISVLNTLSQGYF